MGYGVEIRLAQPEEESPSAKSLSRICRFRSRDGATIVSLGIDFYALSTRAYSHWGDFSDLLGFVSHAATTVYDLPYSTRIGLRYVNRLSLDNTRLTSVPEMLNVLRPELTSLLRVDCWDEPLEMLSRLLLSGQDGEKLTLRSGFQGEDQTFLLDFDYYVEQETPLDQVLTLAKRYHEVIYHAFRWCIREGQLTVFDPVVIEKET